MFARIIPFDPKIHSEEVISIFSQRPDIFPESEMAQIVDSMAKPPEENHIKIVALFQDKVVGYAGSFLNIHKNRWYFDWFSVHPELLRKGIGRDLMTRVIEELRKKRVDVLYVETCSCDGETSARSFYTTQGFVQESLEVDGYAPGHSKITYMKSIA